MRVLTYNIAGNRGKNQTDYLARIADLLLKAEADIAGLQEVALYGDRERPDDLLRRLTGMHVSFAAAHQSRGHILGNLVLSRSPLERELSHSLPGRFPEQRVLQEVRTSADGHPIVLFNTHLVHLATMGSPVRRRQIRRVVEQMHACAEPYVLVGDMNASPRARELGAVRKLDPLRAGDHHDALRSWPARRPLIQYDHIWPGPGWHVEEVRVLGRHVSDHRPVLADVRWSGG